MQRVAGPVQAQLVAQLPPAGQLHGVIDVGLALLAGSCAATRAAATTGRLQPGPSRRAEVSTCTRGLWRRPKSCRRKAWHKRFIFQKPYFGQAAHLPVGAGREGQAGPKMLVMARPGVNWRWVNQVFEAGAELRR